MFLDGPRCGEAAARRVGHDRDLCADDRGDQGGEGATAILGDADLDDAIRALNQINKVRLILIASRINPRSWEFARNLLIQHGRFSLQLGEKHS